MGTKKKRHGFLSVLFVLLFTILLGLFSTSFASVTTDYVGYCVDNLAENFLWDADYQATVRASLSNMSDSTKLNITNRINQGLTNYNISALTDLNMVCLARYVSANHLYLYFVFSNMSAPNSVENLGFLYLNKQAGSWVFGPTTNINETLSTDSIYYFRCDIKLDDSSLYEFTENDLTSSQFVNWSNRSYTSDEDMTTVYVSSASVYGLTNPIYAYYPSSGGTKRQMNLLGLNGSSYLKDNPSEDPTPPDVPEEEGTTGTITDSSGEETGKIDLDGIEQGINQTNQQLEELNQNITTVPDISDTTISGSDITNSLNFDFRGDPYSSFWLDLTTGLSGALTNDVRFINVDFRGKTYTIHLDDFAIQIPQPLKVFLAILSTVFIFWKMIKYVKVTVDNIMSGNMDEVLSLNEEEGIVDLF